MKRLITLSILLLLINVPFSCELFRCKDSCCGETFPYSGFTIESFGLETGYLDTSEPYVSQVNGWQKATRLIFASHGFLFYIGEKDLIEKVSDLKITNPFILSTYACSPAPLKSDQKFTDFKIFSNKEVVIDSISYGSGQDLSPFFVIHNMDNILISEFISEDHEIREEFLLALRLKSELSIDDINNHIFTFEVELDNEILFENNSPEISILNDK